MGPTSAALVTTENNDVHLHHENPTILNTNALCDRSQ